MFYLRQLSERKNYMLLLCALLTLELTVVCRTKPVDPEAAPAFEDILKVDVHSHVFEDIPGFVDMMRRNNLRIVNICFRGNDLEYMQQMEKQAELLHRKYPRHLLFASTFDLTERYESEYPQRVKEWVDGTFQAGAVMVKLWKEVGMEMKTKEGQFLMPDDPILDPLYEHLAKSGKPLLTHLADPLAAWLPLDPDSPHYRYYSRYPEWYAHGRKDFPGYDVIITARDHLLEKYPDLRVIGAHVGSMSHDLDQAADRLDRYPNLYLDTAARKRDLSRHSAEKVRAFFMRYEDRILYGADVYRIPALDGTLSGWQRFKFIRNMEKRYREDYQYYAGSGTVRIDGRKVECLALPRSILTKFFHGNAQRLIPELAF